MSEISAASIIHRADEKEYITGYWQKRRLCQSAQGRTAQRKTAFMAAGNYAPPAAEPQFKNFGHWLRCRLFWHFAGAKAPRYRH